MQSWQRLRLEFNHKWLKNSYLPALGRFINLLRDEIEVDGFEQAFVYSVLPGWEQGSVAVTSLCESFEDEMSPRRLLAEYPLSLLDVETKKWLGEVVHQLWLTEFPVREWVQDAAAQTTAVQDCYQEIAAALRNSTSPPTLDALRPHTQLFERLYKTCQDLARSVEKFPGSILLF